VEEVPGPIGDGEIPGAGIEPGTVFLDTETTGLAGGTGTYVFLVGLAAWTGRTLRITQYFLGDLDGEAAFLHAVAEATAGVRRLVTYNGRTFDLPLLETRYLLARRSFWAADVAHQDLYPLARALWRARVADCRLTTLEGAVLGLDRGDDLPGALLPDLYFRYLRTRDASALPRVFRHNRWDLVALAALQARAETLLAGPDPRHDPRDGLAAARWLERRDPERSAAFYRAALRASLPGVLRTRAAWRLGTLVRRAGRPDEGLAIWEDAVARDPAPPVGLLLDLAKLYEHRRHDPAAALALTRRAAARVAAPGDLAWPPALVAGLARRARRLERRLARAVAVPGS
jgi:hypothetical protein